jgi:hypothetical protein
MPPELVEAQGEFVMANHGESEAARAAALARAAGLACEARYVDLEPLLPRSQPAVLTLWRRR